MAQRRESDAIIPYGVWRCARGPPTCVWLEAGGRPPPPPAP